MSRVCCRTFLGHGCYTEASGLADWAAAGGLGVLYLPPWSSRCGHGKYTFPLLCGYMWYEQTQAFLLSRSGRVRNIQHLPNPASGKYMFRKKEEVKNAVSRFHIDRGAVAAFLLQIVAWSQAEPWDHDVEIHFFLSAVWEKLQGKDPPKNQTLKCRKPTIQQILNPAGGFLLGLS